MTQIGLDLWLVTFGHVEGEHSSGGATTQSGEGW